jgi:excisionase family DNA binding protein
MSTTTSAKGTALPLLLTIPQAAEQIGVAPSTVYEYISDGDLEAVDIARPGAKTTRLRVPLSALQAFIASLPRVHAPT